MKRNVITAVVCIILGVGAGWLLFRPSPDKGTSRERKILYYRDPMNPQNTSPTPKKVQTAWTSPQFTRMKGQLLGKRR